MINLNSELHAGDRIIMFDKNEFILADIGIIVNLETGESKKFSYLKYNGRTIKRKDLIIFKRKNIRAEWVQY